MKYNSLEELYQKLRIVFDIKLRILKKEKYTYINKEDIWKFLAETKWIKDNNLGIAEIVNDIINCDNYEIDMYLKERLADVNRKLYF